MELNFTRLEELVFDVYKVYNVSLAVSLVSCFLPNGSHDEELHSWNSTSSITFSQDGGKGHSAFDLFFSFFSGVFGSNSMPDTNDVNDVTIPECIELVNVNHHQMLSFYCIIYIFVVVASIFFFITSYLLCCCICQNKKKKSVRSQNNEEKMINHEIAQSSDHIKDVSKSFGASKSISEIRITHPTFITVHSPIAKMQYVKQSENMDEMLESMIQFFLKQLNKVIGTDSINNFIPMKFPTSNCFTTLSRNTNYSTLNGSSVQSPKVRRKWSIPQDLSPNTWQSQCITALPSNSNGKIWSHFSKFCNQLNWSTLSSALDLDNEFCIYDTNTLNENQDHFNDLLKFIRQNYELKAIEWSVMVSTVNHILYIIDQFLRNFELTDKDDNVLSLLQFQAFGSAQNGTLLGKTGYFDVMFLFVLKKLQNFNIMHNNYSDKIQSGHVVIEVENKEDLHKSNSNNKFVQKCSVNNKSGFYLAWNEIEKIADELLKKVVRKLNIIYKKNVDQLPFKLSTSSNKLLELFIDMDSQIFNKYDLHLPRIVIRFMPSIEIISPDFAFMPKLFAVPSWRYDHRRNWDEKRKNSLGALSKLFPHTNSSRLPSNLSWNLSVYFLEVEIRDRILKEFDSIEAKECYQSCLMALKALFCLDHKRVKGSSQCDHINSYILTTVVDFLLIESSSSSWEMSKLCDRFSDAVHFLKSAYTNVWLPNFVIHNPHLNKRFPSLDKYAILLYGRQQNLLADYSNASAQKILTFIDERLYETELFNLVKPEYSEDMWEYEFFLFG